MPPPPGPTARICVRDSGLVHDRRQRTVQLHHRVDVHHAQPIAATEQLGRTHRGLVGELELGLLARAHRHRTRVVDGDHLGEARAAPLLLEIERDRAHVLDRCFRVAAGTHRAVAAHQHESAAEIAHVAGERLELRRREIAAPGCRSARPGRRRRNRRDRRARPRPDAVDRERRALRARAPALRRARVLVP